ncbi:hypothetical protein [Terrarubrum flagellatum]|uniref:hypothetical protein n=1 Tax=Terrirubrum flagellatum TaxID=2895980 RepID=UPI0031456257
MPIDEDHIRALLSHPAESLQVEIKNWLDLSIEHGKEKLIRAIFAIRNRNGGFVLIGFDDKTLKADPYNFAEPVSAMYHVDKIQGLVSRYANEPFEVQVALRTSAAQEHPVVVVPTGVDAPVVVKSELRGKDGKQYLREGDLYFRSLKSNGTPSSGIIKPSDFRDLINICFENREADIGGFFRRQLGGVDLARLRTILGGINLASTPPNADEAVTTSFLPGVTINRPKELFCDPKPLLEEGERRFKDALGRRDTENTFQKVEKSLAILTTLALEPRKENAIVSKEFLNRIGSSNPNYTGWPAWLDSRFFSEEAHRAYVIENGWEEFISSLDGGWSQHFEFLRFDPTGLFILRRVLQDDLSEKAVPGKSLDPSLMIYRVVEILAVGLIIAKASGWREEDTATFAFRWYNLGGRSLSSWANPRLFWGGSGKSHTPQAESCVRVPLSTAQEAVAPFVAQAVAPLFACFDGYEMPLASIETLTKKLIQRALD